MMMSFTMRVIRTIHGGALLLAALLLATPVVLRAQSNLSSQGFGYPTGQFSTRASGAGGSLGEMDPLSPINPAAIGQLGSRLVYFQIEPEYRTVTTSAGPERTTTARYPIVFGAIPIGSRWVFSIGSSTLLDRTSSTSFNTIQVLNGTDSIPMTTTYKIDGAMNDVRLASAFLPTSWLHLGLGVHAITGRNLITLTQAFPSDTTEFSSFTQQRVLGFSGKAVSGGVQLMSNSVEVAFSGRAGGTLNLSASDTALTSANVPNRYGASIAYTGIANSAIAVRTSRENWSSLGSLGSKGLVGVDAWDTSIGADIAGPRWGERSISLRGGFRDRTLPFQTSGHTVTEKSISGGVGTSLANGHVLADLALIHADRTAAIAASEKAWIISLGLSVRP